MKNIHILATDKPSRLAESAHGYKLHSYSLNYPTQMKFNRHIYITNDEEIKDGDYALYLFGNLVQKVKIGINVSNKEAHKKIILTTDKDLIKDGVQAIDDDFLEWFVKNPSCEKIEIEYSYIAIKISKPSPKIYKIIIPKEEPKIISDWLEQNRNPEIDKQVEKEAEQLSKQETLEETAFVAGEESFKEFRKGILEANRFDFVCGFTAGAKWQQEQYTIEEQHVGHTIDELDKEYIKGFNEGSAYYIERMYSEEEMLKMLHKFGFDYIYNYRGEKTIYEWIPEWFEQFKKK